MNDIKQQFQKVIKSKTIKEMLINIPWNFIYFILFIPLFLMMVLPFWQLAEDFIAPVGQMASFQTNILTIHNIATLLGMISVLLVLFKITADKNISSFSLFSSYKPVIFFGILIIIMLISTAANGITDYVKYGDEYRNESLMTSVMYFTFYFFSASIIKTKRKKALLIYLYMISSIPTAVCEIINSCIRPLEAFSMSFGRASIFFHANHYGYYILINLLLSEVLFIKEKKSILKILCGVIFVLNTFILMFNNTFGCYLAVIIALVFSVIVLSLCEKKVNKKAIIILPCFIAVTLFLGSLQNTLKSNVTEVINNQESVSSSNESGEVIYTSTQLRMALIKHTISYIKEKPVLGFGIEGIGERLEAEPDTDNSRPHCEFLQYAAFYGIPAAIAYICGVFCVFLNGLKKRYELDIYTIAALVASFGYLVSSALGNTTFYITPVFFILLGLAFNTRKTNE